jgi:hypothetical protein
MFGNWRMFIVKKLLTLAAFSLTFLAGVAFAYVKDWHDLDAVHKHVKESIAEMDRARAANHYDMAGHGAKAVEFLHQAERELDLAVEAAKKE